MRKKKYLGGPVSLSHYWSDKHELYILGDQHVQKSRDSAGECSPPTDDVGMVWGLEGWLEEVLQQNQGKEIHVILEIDPLLTQTMHLTNTWIAQVEQHLQTRLDASVRFKTHYCDVRGESLASLFGSDANKINRFLTRLYEAADVVRGGGPQQPLPASLKSSLRKLLAEEWDADRVLTRANDLAQLVDTFVQNLIHDLLQNGEGKALIIVFVGEAHARVYRKWLAAQHAYYRLHHKSAVPVTSSTTMMTKCLDVSDVF